MRHWITDDSELRDEWIDEYISELSENLYGIAEFKRLAKYAKGTKPLKKFYKDECKELLIELIYIIFNNEVELSSYYKKYHKQVKEDEL